MATKMRTIVRKILIMHIIPHIRNIDIYIKELTILIIQRLRTMVFIASF